MAKREAHCAYFRDNGRGRCMANCSINITNEFDSDCIGNTGKSMDNINHHEAQVTCGFIDGRGVEVDSKGYRVAKTAPTAVVDAVTGDTIVDNTEHTDPSGWKYVWASTPAGVRYKKYTQALSQRQGGITI